MIFTEWNWDDAISVAKEEGEELGIKLGEARGKKLGIKLGEARGKKLGIKLGEARGEALGMKKVFALLEKGVSLKEAKKKLQGRR